jgi:hypothetical protein
MGKQHLDDALKLARIRRDILTYCEPLPQLIKTHGSASLGSVTLAVGKCLNWIGPVLDRYSLTQPLPGQSLPTVTALGEELRVLGIELLNKPDDGELARTIDVLKKQVQLLQELAVLRHDKKGRGQ